MAFPVVLYINLCRTAGAVLAASSTEGGYSVNDISNYRAWKVWKSGTVVTGITIDIDLGSDIGVADTIGLVNHNITSEAGTVQLLADTAAGPNPPTTVRQAAYTPAYGEVDLQQFATASNLRRWRIVLAKGGNFTNKPYIGELFIGLRTTMPEYLPPDTDPFLKQIEASVTQSQGGQYLGAVLRSQQHRFNLAFGDAGATRAFYTTDLNAFINGHVMKRRPFIFQIDSADADFKQPVYVKMAEGGDVTRKAVGGVWSRLMLSIPCEEAHAEAP